MLRGLDFFSRRAIAESGIGDDGEADVAAAPPVSEVYKFGSFDKHFVQRVRCIESAFVQPFGNRRRRRDIGFAVVTDTTLCDRAP